MMFNVREFWLPLDSRSCFVVKYGAMRRENIQRMVNHHPGSVAVYAYEADWIRVIQAGAESLDRLAGAISEDC